MSSTRDRRITGPPMSKSLLEHQGRGAPQPQPPLPPGPNDLLRPRVPNLPHPPNPPNPIQSVTDQVTKRVSDALGASFQSAANSIIGPGEVLLGVVLIVAGLLLATGQMGRVARTAGRAGLFAATRGALK